METWPKEDRVRWVEWELLRAEHGADWEKSAIADRPLDLKVWLAKERDNESWKQIGTRYFLKAKLKPEARRSEARRAYERVERYLRNPNAPEFRAHALNRKIQEIFGVSPTAFREFIRTGRLPQTRQG